MCCLLFVAYLFFVLFECCVAVYVSTFTFPQLFMSLCVYVCCVFFLVVGFGLRLRVVVVVCCVMYICCVGFVCCVFSCLLPAVLVFVVLVFVIVCFFLFLVRIVVLYGFLCCLCDCLRLVCFLLL